MKSSHTKRRKSHRRARLLAVMAILVSSAFMCSLGVLSQSQNGPTDYKGETQKVVIVPNTTTDAGEIMFKPDTDDDGMPDADEAANGTDPNDPSDADADADGDGLSNGDEVANGTRVREADSDGDGFSDGEELRLGFNPLDPNSHPPTNTATLVSLSVKPSTVRISINAFFGQQPVRLRVTGVFSDDTTEDLTGSPTLSYQSLDEGVALIDSGGTVAGTSPGSTSIRITSGSVTAEVPVNVTALTPGALSQLVIPGYANNVDVAGDYAYVAAGEAGLVVVDAHDKLHPQIVATLDTPGNADDVRIVGAIAYVADGSRGLQVIDVSTPTTPSLIGSLDTSGEAQDVVVYGNRAYIADGPSGLAVVDVSDPSHPALLGSVETPRVAKGVDVSEHFAVVALGQSSGGPVDLVADAGAQRQQAAKQPTNKQAAARKQAANTFSSDNVVVIDVSDPSGPQLVGGLNVLGDPKDVATRARLAYVAAYLPGGIQVVDFSSPDSPRVAGALSSFDFGGFVPRDVELHGGHAFAAEQQFANAVPVVDINSPSDPFYAGAIDFSPLSDYAGTGIAVDSQYVYMTGESFIVQSENGTTGNTRLFIGQYQEAFEDEADTAGEAPEVSIVSPQTGQSVFAGGRSPVSVEATDDVRVAYVELIVNGVVAVKDVVAPYDVSFTVPRDATTVTVEARAVDSAGNATTTQPVTLQVVPDPPPTVNIVAPAEGEQLYEGQYVLLIAEASDNGTIQNIEFNVNGETRPNYSYFYVEVGTTSLTFEATATDDVGNTATTTRTVSVVPDPPPTVNITAPAEGTQLTEGQVVNFDVEANDNLYVSYVEFIVNGQPINPDFSAPYSRSYTVPVGITSLTLEAAASDYLGQRSVTSRTFVVAPDPGTTVSGRVVDTNAQPVEGATLTVFSEFTTQSGADGTFSLQNVPTVRGAILARATATLDGKQAANASLPKAPVTGGTTAVGDITLSVAPTLPVFVGVGEFTGDFSDDLFVGYPDRQSLIYEFHDGQFVPSPSVMPPYGAVSSGAYTPAFFSNQSRVYAQLAGQPGSVTDLLFSQDFGQPQGTSSPSASAAAKKLLPSMNAFVQGPLDGPMQSPVSLSTGLEQESVYTASGSEFNFGRRSEVLAFLAATGEQPLTVRYRSPNAVSDEFDLESEYTPAEVVPVAASTPLCSLKLADVNADGLLDILAVRPISGSEARLVVILRKSIPVDTVTASGAPRKTSGARAASQALSESADFEAPVESPITVRTSDAGRGVDDFSVGGSFVKSYVYVLGDDRVRIYESTGTGAFTPDGEIELPAGQVPTGITDADLNYDSQTDLLVTTRSADNPESKFLHVYLRTGEDTFEPPTTRTYTAPPSAGDTRIRLGQWGGSYSIIDAVVVDGDAVIFFSDVGPNVSNS